ncbi:MAG TPA: hypothetical protein VMZ90_05010 [Vicinamibacterales bacterium]|nr:hypothetical protein [Vicinamibacterales bacterium]
MRLTVKPGTDAPRAVAVTRHPRTRVALIALFATAGVLHFLTPHRFTGIVPPWMPSADLLVAVSGAAELAGAVGLAWAPSRRWAGMGLIALLVAVFPANIQMLIVARHASTPRWWQILLWLRLLLQPALIGLVWRAVEMNKQTRRVGDRVRQ